MRRRTVLAGMAALLAGCTTGDDRRNRPTDTARTTAGTPATSTSTTRTEATDTTTEGDQYELLANDSPTSTAADVRERVTSHDCSELAAAFDLVDSTTACPGDQSRLDVEVTPTVPSLPSGTVEYTVQNSADESFSWNPYGWYLFKYDGTTWRYVAPLQVPAPLKPLEGGESHVHRISVDNTTFYGTESWFKTVDIRLSGMGPGVYGFAVGGQFESEPDREIATAALFGFAGERPPVRPTATVSRVERRRSELAVTDERTGERHSTLVVSFRDGNPDSRLLTEHVLQAAGLRNSISYAATDGIDTVRYVAPGDVIDAALTYLDTVTPPDASRYGFRDYVFRTEKV